jgi:lipopolysaccharide transport system ATP-binding protein
MSDLAIEVEHVWKKFHRGELYDSLRDLVPSLGRWIVGRRTRPDALGDREFWALKDVSFALRRGEALGIIGPNGAGKSTLLKVLSRVLRPNRGCYKVRGRLRALIEVAAGFHADLTGRENIYLNGAILGMRRAQIDRRLDQIIDFSGVGAFIDTPVKRYSSGMQARLGFAIAANMDPDVLLVDEVLSVGDAAFRAKCIRHMEQLVRSHVSVVFISHNLEQVRHLCQKAVVLDRGEVRFFGDVGEACEAYYGCFSGDVGARSVRGEGLARVTRLRVLNRAGRPTFRVGCHDPLAVEIEYRLEHDVKGLGLIVRFAKPGGTIMTGCSTVHGEVTVPAAAGSHLVRLQVDGLPFAAGDYLVTAQLVDRGGASLDEGLTPHPLAVTGPNNHHWDIYLRHGWEVPARPTLVAQV